MALFKLLSREYSVQYTEASLRSISHELKDHLPMIIKKQCYIPEEKNEACYMDTNEWNKFIAALGKKYSSPKTLKKLINNFHQYGDQYVAISQKISKKSLAKLTDSQLLSLYGHYLKILNIYSCYLWLGYLLNVIYTEKAEKLLQNKHLDQDVFAALLSPSKRAGILLLQDLLAGKKLTPGLSHNILKRFGWMSCLDVHNNPWTKEELLEFHRHLKASKKPLSFSNASSIANLSKKEKSFFSIVRELAYVKDMRDVYRRKAIYAILPLFEELAFRMNISRYDLAHMTNSEILAMKVPEDIAARKRGFLICWKGRKIEVTSDKSVINNFSKKIIREKLSKSLSGTVASKGIAKGKVRLVFGIKDLSKVKKGDILVAVTTHPDFVSAMQKAAAIVTNEGGLTSHAAIVSRELGVPCIVNTKVATKVFKDGDMIEVDAINGIITKL